MSQNLIICKDTQGNRGISKKDNMNINETIELRKNVTDRVEIYLSNYVDKLPKEAHVITHLQDDSFQFDKICCE